MHDPITNVFTTLHSVMLSELLYNLRTRRVTVHEVVSDCLSRISAHDGELRAVAGTRDFEDVKAATKVRVVACSACQFPPCL